MTDRKKASVGKCLRGRQLQQHVLCKHDMTGRYYTHLLGGDLACRTYAFTKALEDPHSATLLTCWAILTLLALLYQMSASVDFHLPGAHQICAKHSRQVVGGRKL